VLEILQSIEQIPEAIRTMVRNNAGGHYNHDFFWHIMKPGGGAPAGALAELMLRDFNGWEKFKEEFDKNATSLFGSGWTWAYVDEKGKLTIKNFSGHDGPFAPGLRPLLVLDVWEHAYYLKYQNRRPEYIEAWWKLVDWEAVAKKI
jgi:Fe-Mn family superoxide dismutase